MKIARAAALAVAIALVAAESAQGWVPPHLLVPRPTEEVSAVQPVTYAPPVPLRSAPELEGEAAFGAAGEDAGERLVALREREFGELDRDADELAGDDKLAEAMRKCMRGMLTDLNEETMRGASEASEQQDTLLGALGQSILACFKENVEGPAARIISMAQNLTAPQKQLALRRLPDSMVAAAARLAVETRNAVTQAAVIDPDPAVLTRWVHDDAGVAGTSADEPVPTGPIAASAPEDSGGPSSRFLILCAAVGLFVAFFGWRKLVG